ncbi:hypothetical protein BZA70DRAFT_272989 [Myxozyma melibiosi]|uniref:Uncharacterized protein n=1 Tax=Myxozyma melibiosi TaxID=54550 RepID=A0ABR1FE53_9ASCO
MATLVRSCPRSKLSPQNPDGAASEHTPPSPLRISSPALPLPLALAHPPPASPTLSFSSSSALANVESSSPAESDDIDTLVLPPSICDSPAELALPLSLSHSISPSSHNTNNSSMMIHRHSAPASLRMLDSRGGSALLTPYLSSTASPVARQTPYQHYFCDNLYQKLWALRSSDSGHRSSYGDQYTTAPASSSSPRKLSSCSYTSASSSSSSPSSACDDHIPLPPPCQSRALWAASRRRTASQPESAAVPPRAWAFFGRQPGGEMANIDAAMQTGFEQTESRGGRQSRLRSV